MKPSIRNFTVSVKIGEKTSRATKVLKVWMIGKVKRFDVKFVYKLTMVLDGILVSNTFRDTDFSKIPQWG